ncbi:uncharacterized protein EV422DRAFT_506606 [Fimicolochytrium jonesii]|uniref:uncharacterized protein n=1 Tax=Fimicolochytrium jonesii TaxID=1396493 RepID=UPI0022FEFC32|nr:uncharacterized protein EV422DRAFT_506606 [Fimicolochytrium jonesii]KAI8820887.1 hypothetical protein EV422DRAFT_506606 [Fimicolochytrium jonesii]
MDFTSNLLALMAMAQIGHTLSSQFKKILVPSPFFPSARKVYHEFYEIRKGIYCEDHQCLAYNTVNANDGWKHLNLKIVAGSLGIGRTKPFFEYGGETWTEFHQFNRGDRVDAHVWLEDENGRVYDIVTMHMCGVASVRGKEFRLQPYRIIDGMSKQKLCALGLHYVPSTDAIQSLILEKMKSIVVN